MNAISQQAQDTILGQARTHFQWQDKAVPEALLREVYDLAKMGATSANCSPARFVFVTTDEGRERIKPHLIPSNVEKTMSAPVTVIIGYDLKFYDRVPELFPHAPEAREWFNGSDEIILANAVRNGTLQGAYFMLAARAKGLDCGPMSGYDPIGLDAEIWPDGQCRSNFLCNLGYGDASALHPRLPRLDFADACEVI
ncbi:MAG: malonic semialdehyde reductase [Pseudomonadota bacterium]